MGWREIWGQPDRVEKNVHLIEEPAKNTYHPDPTPPSLTITHKHRSWVLLSLITPFAASGHIALILSPHEIDLASIVTTGATGGPGGLASLVLWDEMVDAVADADAHVG